ncbi:PREDICTED: butyrophilin subfamily 1 member A1-like [Elephantulus edwardii]|uniref:butyrophilin subfamily 1 member A1-like n=1 Tax=Elephantulus edwardii TaxID=28737 RepID=UPI0003F0E62B|nr:PREDICTED: butyrophilin subfamily 1 member A1-like [Elephantulus edwardii]
MPGGCVSHQLHRQLLVGTQVVASAGVHGSLLLNQIKEEKEQFQKENEQLKKANDQINEETDQIKEEKDQIKEEKDQFKEEKEQLQKENDQIKGEKEKRQKENEQLKKANDQIKEAKDQIKEEKEQLQKENDEWKVHVQIVHITLDPATAHPNLILSEDKRQVTWGEKPQDIPQDPQRFSFLPCVLGQQPIPSGRCYWEVEVGTNGFWDLGICRNNVKRKERVVLKPEDGFWVIRFYKNEYWALTSPETQLTQKDHPRKVCVFLDSEARYISFYNMVDKTHIYTFDQCDFYGSLRPLFRLWAENSGCLTILPPSET